jgi:LPXTG-motif cell wall-anchored protein
MQPTQARKRVQKLISSAVAVAMVCSLSTVGSYAAFAADGDDEQSQEVVFNVQTTGTLQTNSTKEFAVYQILVANYFEDQNGDEWLTDVVWGKSSNNTPNTAVSSEALTAIQGLGNEENYSEAERANKLAAYIGSDKSIGTITNGASLVVPTGYYLIEDTTEASDGTQTGLYVVKVIGNKTVTITPKETAVSATLKVKDSELGEDSDGNISALEANDWDDSADYKEDASIPFEITATVNGTYENYSRGYKLVLTSTLDEGLSLVSKATDITLKVGNVEVKAIDDDGNVNYTVSTDDDKVVVTIDNLAQIATVDSPKITVDYTAKIDSDETYKLGSDGNKSTLSVQYTKDANGAVDELATIQEADSAYVFTYGLDISKVDQDNMPLEGATFNLTDAEGNVKTLTFKTSKSDDGQETTSATEFVINGLDAGTYTLTETQAPNGYNTINPITFTINADHSLTTANNPILTLTIDGDATDDTGTSGISTASLSEGLTAQSNTGVISGTVINHKGITLPSTGGMGTTILYVIGGLLIVCAGGALYIRRRNQA